MIRFILVAGITLLCFFNSYSQQQDPKELTTKQMLKQDFGHTWKGITRFYTSPLRWKKNDIIEAGIVAGSFAALTFIDEDARTFFKRQEEGVPQILKDFGFQFGGPINAIVFSGGIYTYGLLAKKNKARKTGILMMSSIAAAGFLQSSIKTIVGRARPGAEEGSNSYSPFSPLAAYHSFPSGHSVVSLVFIHTIARQIDNPLAKIGLYTVGAISPISRIFSDSHWVSDIALGSFLGILTVDYIDNYLTEIYEGKQEKKLTNYWKFKPGFASLKLAYTFN